MADQNLTFRFTVLGRYRSRVAGNIDHVTVRMAGGTAGHLVYCGTLTMSEPEWQLLVRVLRRGLRDRVQVEDQSRDTAAA